VAAGVDLPLPRGVDGSLWAAHPVQHWPPAAQGVGRLLDGWPTATISVGRMADGRAGVVRGL